MSTEENKAAVKRFYGEVWNGDNVDAVADLSRFQHIGFVPSTEQLLGGTSDQPVIR